METDLQIIEGNMFLISYNQPQLIINIKHSSYQRMCIQLIYLHKLKLFFFFHFLSSPVVDNCGETKKISTRLDWITRLLVGLFINRRNKMSVSLELHAGSCLMGWGWSRWGTVDFQSSLHEQDPAWSSDWWLHFCFWVITPASYWCIRSPFQPWADLWSVPWRRLKWKKIWLQWTD